MKKYFKPVFVIAILAVCGVVNAQEADASAVAVPIEEAVSAETAASVGEAATQGEETVAEPVEASVLQAVEAAKPKHKKKKKGAKAPKNDFAVVDVPADFEIQGKKIMPIDSDKDTLRNNLDEWWGRANLMVLTESENFAGKVHLRMYPGEFANKVMSADSATGKMTEQNRDRIEIYEAWAWYRGEYFSLKVGRMDNTTRFGSMTYGGYLDAKRDKYWDATNNYNRMISNPQVNGYKNYSRRISGFMSSYNPENALQFGLNFMENLSLDLALISTDKNLNKGDLRAYFRLQDIAGIDDLNLGLGYRSNLFDEIKSKYGDVVHTVDLGVRVPIISDVGFLKNLTAFVEAAILGLDDQNGRRVSCDSDYWRMEEVSAGCRTDIGKANAVDWPILGGLDIALYRGLDKIVIEAEYDSRRTDARGTKKDIKDVLGSIYFQKALLNDRFTLSLGLQSENKTKDISFAGRLNGRIN